MHTGVKEQENKKTKKTKKTKKQNEWWDKVDKLKQLFVLFWVRTLCSILVIGMISSERYVKHNLFSPFQIVDTHTQKATPE